MFKRKAPLRGFFKTSMQQTLHTPPKILITKLPLPTNDCSGAWCKGIPIHKGLTEKSLNEATVWAAEKNIIPEPKIIEQEWHSFKNTLESAGAEVVMIDFPEPLNTSENRDHDAVFIRDSGLMFGNYWIKSHFSVAERQAEADYYAEYIKSNFDKTIIELPVDAFVEGGDLWYVQSAHGSFYFGGLSRSNTAGHLAVQKIIQADHFFVIESNGYHIDTILTPILNTQNELIALLIGKDTLSKKSLADLKSLNIELIFVDPIDCIGSKEVNGTLAINGLAIPGKLINSHHFQTPDVEARLAQLGIERLVTPLTQFAFAGGSVHCLTNEVR